MKTSVETSSARASAPPIGATVRIRWWSLVKERTGWVSRKSWRRAIVTHTARNLTRAPIEHRAALQRWPGSVVCRLSRPTRADSVTTFLRASHEFKSV